jgi:SAM-dependent methyltransferase
MRDDEYRAMFDLEDRLWWYSGMRSISGSILEEGLKTLKNPRVLDVGCGTGYSMLWLSRRLGGADCFGVDPSPRAAELWPLKNIETSSIASATSLPFPAETFDLVTGFDVAYQLDRDGAAQAFHEFSRVLKPQGLLLIREPAYDWLRGSHDSAVGTRHRFTRRELVRLLSDAGFAIRRATYANALLLWLAIPYRLFSRGETSDVKPVSATMNRLLEAVLRIEAAIIRRTSLPAGLSIVILGERS